MPAPPSSRASGPRPGAEPNLAPTSRRADVRGRNEELNLLHEDDSSSFEVFFEEEKRRRKPQRSEPVQAPGDLAMPAQKAVSKKSDGLCSSDFWKIF